MDKPNLLLVDDEEGIIDALCFLFRREYKVFATTNPGEAVDILKNNNIHVLLTDQRMPKLTGVELLRQAIQISPNTTRLLLTGYSDLNAIVDSINEGEVFRYIHKPWQNSELKDKIHQAADIARGLENPPPSPKALPEEKKETHILIIDNDSNTIDKVKNALRTHHCTIHQTAQLDEAIDIIKKENIAIVVSELVLDEENISSFLKLLKQKYPHIVSMVVTPFQDKEMLVDLINQAQVFRFMAKPVIDNLMTRNLQSAISYYKKNQLNPSVSKRHVVEQDTKEDTQSKSILGKLMRLKK